MTDKELILAASKYRSGNDSCNSFYMGSMATSTLIHILGGQYGKDGIEKLLEKATDRQIDKAKDYCMPYIEYMTKHSTKICPCCGGIIP